MPPAAQRDSQPFAGQSASGQSPVFSHDEAGDLQVVEISDTHEPDSARYNYGDTYPGIVATDGSGSTLYNTFILAEWIAMRYPMAQRIWQAIPGSWIFTVEVEKDSLALVFTKRRKNIAANIHPKVLLKTGSGVSLTAVLTGASVSSVTIGGSGTGYADYTAVVFAAGGGTTAQGYMTASNGTPNGFVVTEPGSGYGSAPAIKVLPNSVVEVARKDINNFLAWEIVTVTTDSPYNSFTNAKAGQRTQSYTMPERINVLNMMLTGLQEENIIRPEAKDILVDVYEWWVNSVTEPSIPSDPILSSDEISVRTNTNSDGYNTNLGDFRNVLNDAFSTFVYGAPLNGTAFLWPRTFAASTPSFSDYEGWVAVTGSIASGAPSDVVLSAGTLNTGDLIAGIAVATGATAPGTAVLASPMPFPSGVTSISVIMALRPGSGWVGNKKVIDSKADPVGANRWHCFAVKGLML